MAAAYSPSGLRRAAADGRGPGRLRALRLGPQGRDAEPRARRTALVALQKMLHRAGNVDGEGDGCGVMVDIPRRIWAEEVRKGGHAPRSRSTPPSRSARVRRAQRRTSSKVQHDARQLLGRGGMRILAERQDEVDTLALGPDRARGGAALLAVRRPRARRDGRDRALFELALELEERARPPRRLVLGGDLRLQGDGRAEGAQRLLQRPRRPALRDRGAAWPQPLLDQHLAVVHARPAVLGARPQRRDQHDRAAAPGGAHARRRRSATTPRTRRT